jgi:hypothetical protein
MLHVAMNEKHEDDEYIGKNAGEVAVDLFRISLSVTGRNRRESRYISGKIFCLQAEIRKGRPGSKPEVTATPRHSIYTSKLTNLRS